MELTDEKVVPYAIERLRTVYPNVLEMVYLKQEERTPAVRTEAAAVPPKRCWNCWKHFIKMSASIL